MMGKDDRLHASTPPIEALRVVFSYGASIGETDGRPHGVMVNDISRAYFYAPAKWNLFINLPKEALQAKED